MIWFTLITTVGMLDNTDQDIVNDAVLTGRGGMAATSFATEDGAQWRNQNF